MQTLIIGNGIGLALTKRVLADDPHRADVMELAKIGPRQLRLSLSLLDEEPNRAFFRSLMLSDKRGHSHEKECRGQPAGLMRWKSAAVGRGDGLGTLAVTRGSAFSSSRFSEVCCCNCCCLAAKAAAMVLRR